MKILLIGAGSIGLYMAARLVKGGFKPTILARSNYCNLLDYGFKIEEMTANNIISSWVLKPNIHFDVVDNVGIKSKQKWDMVILATQTTQLENLYALLPKVLTADGVCVALQNGFDFESELSKALPGRLIISGTAWIKVSTIDNDKEFTNQPCVRHYFGLDLWLGIYGGFKSHIANYVFKYFTLAGFKVTPFHEIKCAQWTKLILNVPFFILCALYNKSVSEILHSDALNTEMHALRSEMLMAAKNIGYELNIEYVDNITTTLATMPVIPLKPNDKIIQRMIVELESNAGNLIRYLNNKHIKLQLLEKYYHDLQSM